MESQEDKKEVSSAPENTSTEKPEEKNDPTKPQQESTETQQDAESSTFPIYIKTCGEKKATLTLQVSPIDNTQDIKQYLFESIDTCYITNYHIYVDGKKINDFVELSQIEEIKPKAVLEMVEALYDERSIRLHVRRLREILLSADNMTASPSVFSQVTGDDALLFPIAEQTSPDSSPPDAEENDKESPTEDKESPTTTAKTSPTTPTKEPTKIEQITESDIPADSGSSLGSYYPPPPKAAPQCVKNIIFSGWNPPSGNRKLSGDLIYLEVHTAENRPYHITGWSKGFFVNCSTTTNFNPNPAEKPCHSHSLVGLLNQLSPTFKKNFVAHLAVVFKKHPFEMFPVPFPVHPWVAQKEKPTYDMNRAEDSLLHMTETEIKGQMREWNEEYQTCKELPSETIQERITRDRALVKINCDFVEAAIKGACAIVEKTVPPLNPLDPERAHMYLYNNIFFSYAMDSRDLFKEYGGDKAAYVSVNNDLKGIKLMNRVDVKGLYTLATVLVDYRGYRVVAQSIIPGILQREQTSNVVYGSIDNGKTIASDPSFHELLVKAGKQLHLAEHTVKDGENKEFKLCAPIESKGIVGTDNRKYILDMVRFTPRDANYSGKENIFATLRYELVAAYYEHLKIKEEEKERQKKEAEAKEKPTEKKDQPTDESKKAEDDTDSPPPLESLPGTTTKQEDEEEEDKKEIEFPGLNPNVLCEYNLAGTSEEISDAETKVMSLAGFLMDTMIPILMEDLSFLGQLPIDGQTLTYVMHNHGVNMRYLGLVTTLVEKTGNSAVREICIREMITRSAKHIFRAILRETEDFNLAGAITHFLNCLFGSTKGKEEKSVQFQSAKKSNKKKNNKTEGVSAFSLSSHSLWSQLAADVKDRFKYELPPREELKDIVNSISTLRSLCQKVGLQIEGRDYDLSIDLPFQSQNILDLFPVVKHCEPESFDGRNLLEVGKQFLNQGRLDIAYELLTEALAIFHQVYGPMHKDTAHCYNNLSMVLYHAKDLVQALDHQQKATVINERVLGMDHHDTAQGYTTLALFSHAMGRHKLALTYINRALYLTRIVSGANHPDTASIYISIATMLQEMQQHKVALHYLFEALKCYESFLGPNSLPTATIYHNIAITYSQIGQFKEALAYEKKNYSILHETVGDNDLRTVESNICLKQFTAKAVQMQIETKKTQRDITAQLSSVKLDKIRNTVNLPNKLGNPLVSASTTVTSTAPSTVGPVPMGNRPLPEVLSYINGKSKSSFTDRNKKKMASPFAISTDKKKKKKTKEEEES